MGAGQIEVPQVAFARDIGSPNRALLLQGNWGKDAELGSQILGRRFP